MANHAHANDNAGSAYIVTALSSPSNTVYLEVDFIIAQAALDAWYDFLGDPGPELIGVLNGDNVEGDRLQLRDNPYTGAYYQMYTEEGWTGASTVGVPPDSVLCTLKLHLSKTVAGSFAVDSDSSTAEDMTGYGPWDRVGVGITTLDRFGEHSLGNEHVPGPAFLDFYEIRAGTTAGGTDLLHWVAADETDLSAFDTVFGDVTFVYDPTPSGVSIDCNCHSTVTCIHTITEALDDGYILHRWSVLEDHRLIYWTSLRKDGIGTDGHGLAMLEAYGQAPDSDGADRKCLEALSEQRCYRYARTDQTLDLT